MPDDSGDQQKKSQTLPGTSRPGPYTEGPCTYVHTCIYDFQFLKGTAAPIQRVAIPLLKGVPAED